MTRAVELAQAVAELGLELSDLQLTQLQNYLALLVKWNRIYNLTAVREEPRMVSYHLLDSLTLVPYVNGEQNMLDVGSGGGMPGIPVAIACPALWVVVLDANHKKVTFLRQAVIELKLNNVEVIHSRVEQYQPAEGFDRIVSRAFAELAEFFCLTRHLLSANGQWLAMKGGYPHEEIGRLPLTVNIEAVQRVFIPYLDVERHLVSVSPR